MSSEPLGESHTGHFAGAFQAAGYVEESAAHAALHAVDTVGVTKVAPSEPQVSDNAGPPEAQGMPPLAAGGRVMPITDAQLQAELAPEPVDDLAVISTIEKPSSATTGWRGALNRVGLQLAPGAAEQRHLEEAAQLAIWETIIRQFVGTEAVGVLVANPKGSSGKTPTSILLGGIIATIRGGSVVVLEVSDDRGTLSFRAEGNPTRGIAELVRDADSIRSAGQLAGYTAPQTSYASIIGSIGNRAPLTHDSVVAAARVIDEFYAIRVMDSGNQPTSSAFAGAIATADALVVPVLNSADVVLEAVAMLDRLRSEGPRGEQLANTAIIVRLVDGRPENPQLLTRLDNIIDRAGIGGVVTIPYDAHIAERGQITLGKIAPATRAAFTHAAATVVQTIQKNTK